MFLITVLVLLGTGLTVNSERHSLTYIYTAFSKPLQLPGIHEFTAMGLLDERMIDYYDSTLRKRVPKQPWMAKRLSADYWEEGTQSRQSKQQWFKVNIDILMTRMRQNDTDIHTLQWMHGCEGDEHPDGSITFYSGMDRYRYDGEDFLYFDLSDEVWVASIPAAEPIKRKWDNVQVLKEYTKGYLEKECMNWLRKFVEYGNAQLKAAKAPEIYVFAKNTTVKTNVVLTCLGTGFYPKHISMEFKRNGRVLTRDDGLTSAGSVPNHDNTYQRRDRIEILREDLVTYTCEVSHKASGYDIIKTWDKILPPDEDSKNLVLIVVGAIGGVVATVVIVVSVLCALSWFGIIGGPRWPSDGASENSSVRSSSDVHLNMPPWADNSSNSSAEVKPLMKDGSHRGSDSGVSSNGGRDGGTPEPQSLMGSQE
ncbi:class I histocompatibility antigen, F10 alpha chain-like [Halichoeres trimaculatus]|uniref:class I histocompatibility antigen, F10 alpha chain-like n=1 Tax=Halichoeres trimaculatus TaxID=147232 RepID=UPI003D9EC3BA